VYVRGVKEIDFGRYVFGLSAIAFGVLAFAWRDFNIWQQIGPLGLFHGRESLLYVIAVIEILGGLAILWPRTARGGAAALGVVYLFFALLWLPLYVEKPIYDHLANFFEQFSLVSGALIVYATAGPSGSPRAARLARIGYYGFGISVVSFTLDQAFYLHGTAKFVPKWIPPGQMFWAVTTTIAFALAAIGLLTGRYALLASQLLTVMIAGFGLLVWLPAPFAHPRILTAWAGNAENWAICGAAWIVADFLRGQRSMNW
jgi:uncharacterized membrane protein YphA (DoxX/SURF4 family)